jgi:mRNA-degrading endonuclease toxin of MazEF toxin-antitoxin module
LKKFDEWCEVKKQIDNSNFLSFKEREIFMGYIGENVGYEQNGKGSNFLRPILILKKYNKELFLGVILSHTCKKNRFYFQINEDSCVILSQIRVFSVKRLKYFKFRLNESKFNEIIKKITEMLPHKGERTFVK